MWKKLMTTLTAQTKLMRMTRTRRRRDRRHSSSPSIVYLKNKNDKKDKKIFHRLAHTIGAAHHILRSLALSPGRSRINSSTFVFWFTNK